MAAKTQIGKYSIDLGKQIGRGAFGAVYFCMDHQLGVKVAAKQFTQVYTSREKASDIRGELIAINKKLKHETLWRYLTITLKMGFPGYLWSCVILIWTNTHRSIVVR